MKPTAATDSRQNLSAEDWAEAALDAIAMAASTLWRWSHWRAGWA